MFDLQTNQSIVVTGLSTAVKQASPNATFEIWGRSGSHVNAEDSSHAGWVQLGSAGPIAVEEESVVSLPTTLNLRLAAGATHALLVLRTDEENNVSYAEASGNRGDVVASNAHLKILSGSSVGLDFDAPSTSWEFSNSPRNFIGEVRYSAQPAELRAVPTLSAWALTLLGLLAAGLGLRSKRRLA